MTQAIDPNKLEWAYRTFIGDADNRHNTYALNFTYEGQPYTFVPKSVIDKGVTSNGSTTIFQNFLDKNNLKNFLSSSTPIDLSKVSDYGDYLNNTIGASSSGYLVPGSVDLGPTKTFEGVNISGLTEKNGQLAYNVINPSHEENYISASDPSKVQQIDTVHNGGGGFFGGIVNDLSKGLANLDSSLHLSELAPLIAAVGLDYATGGAASGTLSSIFGGGGTAAQIAASDLAAYPTAGIVGSLPEAAGAANGIAAAGAGAAGELGASGAGLTSGAGTTGLSAIANPSLAAGAPLTAAAPAAAGMGGGTGLTAISNIGAAAGAPLAAAGAAAAGMGGGTGLTVPAAGGGTVGAGGVIPSITGPVVSSGGVNGVGNPIGTIGATDASNLSPSLLKQLTDATGLTGTQLASLLQGGIGAYNASNISNAIGAGVDAQAAANAASQGVLKSVYDTQLGFQQPYQTAGTNAINKLDASQPYLTHQFNAADLKSNLAPNYDFMLKQGQMANQRAANVGGGALSGNTLQGLQNYTQNYAGNAYQNAFNNYQTQRGNIYNSLAGIAGMGQTANTGAGTAAQNYGTGTVNLNTGLAGVRSAGLLGQAQAGASGTTGIGNSVLLSTLLNQVNPIKPGG